MKSGYKTTEFWLTAIMILSSLSGVATLPVWVTPIGVGVYTLARSLAKSGVLRGDAGRILSELPAK